MCLHLNFKINILHTYFYYVLCFHLQMCDAYIEKKMYHLKL